MYRASLCLNTPSSLLSISAATWRPDETIGQRFPTLAAKQNHLGELSKTACVQVLCILEPVNQKLCRWEQDNSVRAAVLMDFDPSSELGHRTGSLVFNWECLLGLWCSKPLSTLISCSKTVCFSFLCPNFLYFFSFFCLKTSQFFPYLLSFTNTLTISQHTLWPFPMFNQELTWHEVGFPSYHGWQIYETGHLCGTWVSVLPMPNVSVLISVLPDC